MRFDFDVRLLYPLSMRKPRVGDLRDNTSYRFGTKELFCKGWVTQPLRKLTADNYSGSGMTASVDIDSCTVSPGFLVSIPGL